QVFQHLPFQIGEIHHALCPAIAGSCWPASGCSAAESRLLAWSAACDNFPTALIVASCCNSWLGCSPSIGRIWFCTSSGNCGNGIVNEMLTFAGGGCGFGFS